jgi:hypothetical protein
MALTKRYSAVLNVVCDLHFGAGEVNLKYSLL